MRLHSASLRPSLSLLLAASAIPVIAQSAAAQSAPILAQMAQSDTRIRSAVAVIDREWGQVFAASGARYSSPHIIGYVDSTRTPCGEMTSGNAYACRLDGSIYYDRVFLASLMAQAHDKLGTDGDMAAIVPIAHEWGHAVQYMLNLDYTNFPERVESDADCLAGAIIARSQQEGYLEPGDIAESEYTLGLAGDPPLVTGVWGRTIEKINGYSPSSEPIMKNSIGDHGNPRERIASFRHGMQVGPRGCIAGIPTMPRSSVPPWRAPITPPHP